MAVFLSYRKTSVVAGGADENEIAGVVATVFTAGTAAVAGDVVADEAGVAARSGATTVAVAQAAATTMHLFMIRLLNSK